MKFILLVTIVGGSTLALNVKDSSSSMSRRRLFRRALATAVSTTAARLAVGELSTFLVNVNPCNAITTGNDVITKKDSEFLAFQVIPDDSASLDPTLVPLNQQAFLSRLLSPSQNGRGFGSIWLGEHHNSVADHNLQAEIIREMHFLRKGQPMAVGLEQVQRKFQSVLDDYVSGSLSLDQFRRGVEWDKRWMWPFEAYEPIFTTCRELRLPLVALNVNSEDLALVEKYGYQGLSKDILQEYITDPIGFAAFANQEQFRTYVDYVIRPSYDVHREMGLLRTTMNGEKLPEEMSFRNFFSGRILWDEGMASAAYSWTRSNPGGIFIGLVGADHVKFRDGIPGRFARMAGVGAVVGDSSTVTSDSCVSVMLNPTLIDTRPSGSVANVPGADSSQFPDKVTLQLRYLKDGIDINSPSRDLPASTGGVLPLADYMVIG